MSCPPEIASILLEIMRVGVVRIRQRGWAGDAQRCAVEADHIHNLPELVGNYSPALLSYYWEAERTAYASQSSAGDLAVFEPLWERLGPHVPTSAVRAVAQ